MNALKSIEKLSMDDEDANIGVKIVRKALESPMRQIAGNAGEEGASPHPQITAQEFRRRALERSRVGHSVWRCSVRCRWECLKPRRRRSPSA